MHDALTEPTHSCQTPKKAKTAPTIFLHGMTDVYTTAGGGFMMVMYARVVKITDFIAHIQSRVVSTRPPTPERCGNAHLTRSHGLSAACNLGCR